MKTYRKGLIPYLEALAEKEAAPAGGSAVCLCLCLVTSLLEKALKYSLKPDLKTKRINKILKSLPLLRKKILLYLDEDGEIFVKAIKNKGKKRLKFIKKSQALTEEIARTSWKVFSLAKKIESDIKKSIKSDFFIALELIELSLKGCIYNLEANRYLFQTKSQVLKILLKKLAQVQKYGQGLRG